MIDWNKRPEPNKRKVDHVIAHDATQGELAYAIECRHCGAIQKFSLPISISVYVAASRAFVDDHARCKKP